MVVVAEDVVEEEEDIVIKLKIEIYISFLLYQNNTLKEHIYIL